MSPQELQPADRQENLYPYLPILMVDDESNLLSAGRRALRSEGFNNVVVCQDSRLVMELVESQDFSVVLLDLVMPHVSGQELLAKIVARFPHLPVIIVTGLNDVEMAVSCIKAGAFDFLVKPVEPQRMAILVRHAVEHREISLEHLTFRERVFHDELMHPEAFSAIVTRDQKMRAVFQYVEAIAASVKPVLVTGETGVGKELIVRAVHSLSNRPGPLVAVNVAGLDDHVFSDTLFGHFKGAFTGADKHRPGLIETAAGGTLFLDEIGDLGSSSQVKLLRLLQEGEYYPLGADMPKMAAIRVIAATNQNLAKLKDEGCYRADLFYRLQNHQIHIPPLRERPYDLPFLVDHFLEQAAYELGKKKPSVPGQLVGLLAAYHFPGNIRELAAMIYNAVYSHTRGVLSLAPFKQLAGSHSSSPSSSVAVEARVLSPFSLSSPLPSLKEAERQLIVEAMRRANNNQSVAAQLLGISRSGVSKALKRHGLSSS